MIEAIFAVKWKQENGSNVPDFSAVLKAGEAWEDITGNYHPAPIYLIRVRLNTKARYDAAKALPGIIALAWRELDAEGSVVDGNYDEQPTGGQLTTLYNLLLTTFPGVDSEMLKDKGQEILAAGLTREQIINKLAARFKRL